MTSYHAHQSGWKWPVDPCKIDEEYLKVPTALLDFFELLLSGNIKDLLGRVRRLAYSYAFYCLYGVSEGQHKTALGCEIPNRQCGACQDIKSVWSWNLVFSNERL